MGRYKMSENPVKNHGKKPQRNSPCKETQKRRYITRGNVFLPGFNKHAQYIYIQFIRFSCNPLNILLCFSTSSTIQLQSINQLRKLYIYILIYICVYIHIYIYILYETRQCVPGHINTLCIKCSNNNKFTFMVCSIS